MVLPAPLEIEPKHRAFLEFKRRAMIMELGALEDFLGIPRSIPPKHKRKNKEIRDTLSSIDKVF